MFKQTHFLLFGNSFIGIKSKVGATLSILILSIFTLIIGYTFNNYLDQQMTLTKVDDLIENHQNINMTLVMSYPKEIKKFGRWVTFSNRMYNSIEYLMKECEDEEFFSYFSNTIKDINKTYICAKIKNPLEVQNIFLATCDSINNNYSFRRLKDPTCKQTLKNLTKLNEIMYNNKYSTYNLYYNLYNATTKLYSYNNLSLPYEGNKTDYYYLLDTYFDNIIIDSNELINNVEIKPSTNITVNRISTRFIINNYTIFQMVFINKDITKSIYYSMKINIILSILMTIFKILLGVCSILIVPYTNYCYKFHVLSNDFSKEDYKAICNNESSKINENSNKEDNEEILKKNCLNNYTFFSKLKSYFTISKNYLEIENSIIEKLSLEKILIDDEEKYKLYKKSMKKISFLSKLDFLSNIGFIKFELKSSYSSLYHYLVTIVSVIIFFSIFIGVGKNMYDNNNKLELIDTRPFTEYKFNNKSNKMKDKLIRINIPIIIYESIKIVKTDPTNNSYSYIENWPCSKIELINNFNSKYTKNSTIDICIKLNDALNDVFNTKISIHEIHVITCTDAPNLFKESDCKNTIANEQEINIEVEFCFGFKNNLSLIEKGFVKYNKKSNKEDKGYFRTDVILYKYINSIEVTETLKILSSTFVYDAIYNSKISLFSWIIIFPKPYYFIIDKRDTEFLTILSVVFCYYGILMMTLNLVISPYLEYLYFIEAQKNINHKFENAYNKSNILVMESKIEINLNTEEKFIENNKVQNDVVELPFTALNTKVNIIKSDDKKEINNKLNTELKSRVNFFNYLLFKCNLLSNNMKFFYSFQIKHIKYNSLLKNKVNRKDNDYIHNSVLNFFDFLSNQTNFYLIKGDFIYKNSIGGLISIVILLILLPSIYYLNEAYFLKINPKIRSSKIPTFEAYLNPKFAPIYDFSLKVDKALYEILDIIIPSKSVSFNLHTPTITETKCKKTLKNNYILDNYSFCTSSSNFTTKFNSLGLKPNCINNNLEDNCTNYKYYLEYYLSVPTYEIEKMHNGLSYKNYINKFELSVKDFPIYEVTFQGLLVNVNEGLIFNDYRQYNFTKILSEKFTSKSGDSIKNIEIFFIGDSFYQEVYVNNKTFTECLMEIFSLFNILYTIGGTISNFFNEYFLLKTVLEIQKYKNNTYEDVDLGLFEFTFYNTFLGSKDAKVKIDNLLCMINLDSLI